jgi:hypothetical protein
MAGLLLVRINLHFKEQVLRSDQLVELMDIGLLKILPQIVHSFLSSCTVKVCI